MQQHCGWLMDGDLRAIHPPICSLYPYETKAPKNVVHEYSFVSDYLR